MLGTRVSCAKTAEPVWGRADM